MSNQTISLAKHDTAALAPLQPRVALSFRLATMGDMPFLDALQKKYSKGLGFFPRAQMEGYVTNGWVLIAEEVASCELLVASEDSSASLATRNAQRATRPVGYCASRDQYRKRDELGIIYQLCVEPGTQRKLVAAALVREVFSRSAYGCRLYCCWCAKDLDANYFWESMGFVPIAFRAGSEKKSRVHIFWQKRIVAGDTETKWWYPHKTEGGAMGANRIAFPIPPGVRWQDVEAISVPNCGVGAPPALVDETKKRGRGAHATKKTPVMQVPTVQRMQFGPPGAAPIVVDTEKPAQQVKAKRERACPERSRRAPKVKADPKLVAAARELRDRWMERVNGEGFPSISLTSGSPALGKYDVCRSLDAPSTSMPAALPLPHAA